MRRKRIILPDPGGFERRPDTGSHERMSARQRQALRRRRQAFVAAWIGANILVIALTIWTS